MDCLVQGWEYSQANSRAMVGAAGHVPGWGRTGSAGPGGPCGHRMWPVGLGILEEPLCLIQGVTQREAVWGFASDLLSPSQR